MSLCSFHPLNAKPEINTFMYPTLKKFSSYSVPSSS